jgi:hypothetical protein
MNATGQVRRTAVWILAIGIEDRIQLLIGEEEYDS